MKTPPEVQDISVKKTSAKQTLARVKREMDQPRRAESTLKDADTVANGGHLANG
ncbi:MAG: hypothetical protein M3P27_07135 [Acidobacteriota bacterium]|nr:hypothetical protein [Acidobacteriota bacterium]